MVDSLVESVAIIILDNFKQELESRYASFIVTFLPRVPEHLSSCSSCHTVAQFANAMLILVHHKQSCVLATKLVQCKNV